MQNIFIAIAAGIIGVVVLFILFKQAAKGTQISISPDQELQVRLLQIFTKDVGETEWLARCKSKEEALEEGQIKIWDRTHILRSKLRNSFKDDVFVINPLASPDILQDIVFITKTAFIMTMIQDDVLKLNVEAVDNSNEPS